MVEVNHLNNVNKVFLVMLRLVFFLDLMLSYFVAGNSSLPIIYSL